MDKLEAFKTNLLNLNLVSDKVALDAALQKFPLKDEDWKYTRLNSFIDFISNIKQDAKITNKIEKIFNLEEAIVLENGKVKSHTLVQTKLEQKSILLDGSDFLSDLNLSLTQQEIVLNLDQQTSLNISLHSSAVISAPRIKINCNSNSSVLINISGITPEYFNNYLLKIDLEEDAKLKLIIVQEESSESFSFSNIIAKLSSKSNLEIYSFNFGGKLTRNNISAALFGTGADVKLFGLNILSDDQHLDNHTVLDHAIANCESTEIYKGVYSGKSKGIFDGTIIVRKDAQKTNAIQKNQSLIVGNQAASNSKPQLKIWADDVKCTHGATVGQLDDNAIFYLKARGIPENIAKAMLIKAFCHEILSGIEFPELKQYLDNQISEKLERIVECQQ